MPSKTTLELDDHPFIATHEALWRYVKDLKKRSKPAPNPGHAMVLTAAITALDDLRASCPEHLKEVLGIVESAATGTD